jgi:hypothetical protein
MSKHSATCRRVFGRLDANCERCQDLAKGAPRRRGWGALKRENDERRAREIREHDCGKSKCGPVCTAFDW